MWWQREQHPLSFILADSQTLRSAAAARCPARRNALPSVDVECTPLWQFLYVRVRACVGACMCSSVGTMETGRWRGCIWLCIRVEALQIESSAVDRSKVPSTR